MSRNMEQVPGRTRRTPRPPLARFLALLALLLLVALITGSCREDETDVDPATVSMGEFWFRPAELTVPRNAKVTVVNDGAVVHTWIVKGAGVGTANVRPGQSAVLDLEDIQPGAYTVYCDQPGHTEAGQSGRLTIQP